MQGRLAKTNRALRSEIADAALGKGKQRLASKADDAFILIHKGA
jgi:hypothetical protein